MIYFVAEEWEDYYDAEEEPVTPACHEVEEVTFTEEVSGAGIGW